MECDPLGKGMLMVEGLGMAGMGAAGATFWDGGGGGDITRAVGKKAEGLGFRSFALVTERTSDSESMSE